MLRCIQAFWLFGAIASTLAATPAEDHAGQVLQEITAIKKAITRQATASRPQVFVTFWDFDGTILAGDCSEGWVTNDTPVYKGLAERVILAGHSANYRGPEGWQQFWDDYQRMDQRPGHWLAYPFLAQMMRGASRAAVEELAAKTFQTELSRFYYASSVSILRGLAAEGIEAHVVSASPQVFVRGAAQSLGIPPERMHGISVAEREGRLTEELVYPVTFANGKTRRIEQLMAEWKSARPNLDVWVLGAFGNSYSTDGSFLAWTTRQQLPGTNRPVVLMINGGPAPPSIGACFAKPPSTPSSRPSWVRTSNAESM